jgi:hypothetical protein
VLTAWETILAAIGGLVLGLGIGMWLAGRRVRHLFARERREQTRAVAQLVPILERQAKIAGVDLPSGELTLSQAADLAVAIRGREERQRFALSETIALPASEIVPSNRPPS